MKDIIVIGKIKDYFGRQCEVWYHEDLDEVRFMGKNPRYAAERKAYPDNVGIPRYLEVIDFTVTALINFNNRFPEYADKYDIRKLQIW